MSLVENGGSRRSGDLTGAVPRQVGRGGVGLAGQSDVSLELDQLESRSEEQVEVGVADVLVGRSRRGWHEWLW